MASRAGDWFRQAEADLQHARTSLAASELDWSCFAAQQAAEKGVKAVFLALSMEAWGHTVSALLGALRDHVEVPESLVEAAKMLDKSASAIRIAKEAIETGLEMDFARATRYEADLFGLCFATADAREGLKAFVEKRPPKFSRD